VTTTDDHGTLTAQLLVDGEHRTVVGKGSGPLAAFVDGLRRDLDIDLDIVDYSEHAVTSGSDATAVAFVESQMSGGAVLWGVGMNPSILTASLRAVVGAINRQREASSR
jgi:2-isopropylmalate synthase